MGSKKQMNMRKVWIRAFLTEALNLKSHRVGEAFRIARYYRPEAVYRYLRQRGYVPDANHRIRPLD